MKNGKLYNLLYLSIISFKIVLFIIFKRFKIKYHPDDSIKRKEEQTIALKVRI